VFVAWSTATVKGFVPTVAVATTRQPVLACPLQAAPLITDTVSPALTRGPAVGHIDRAGGLVDVNPGRAALVRYQPDPVTAAAGGRGVAGGGVDDRDAPGQVGDVERASGRAEGIRDRELPHADRGDDRRGALAGRELTLVTDSGEQVAALIHDGPARIDPAAITEAAAAARLLLDTERLEAGTLARVNDLSTARRLAADAARAGLERDLHDLAHGIGSATLATQGLAGAVRTIVENSPAAITIVDLPAERLPERVERAAYRFVADFLAAAGPLPPPGASIAVRRSGQDVVVEVEYGRAGVTGDPGSSHLADRLAAAGGQLRHADMGDRRRLIARLSCG
jgi:PAS domain-containing protein